MTNQNSTIILLAACIMVALLAGCVGDRLASGIPEIRSQPLDAYAASPDTDVKLEVRAAGNQLSYQWFKLEPAPDCTNSTESLTSEVPVPDATNSILRFDRIRPDDYGLYFCEIINRTTKPPFGLVRESRSRLASVGGVATRILTIGTPPVVGSVLAGAGGQDQCAMSSSAYVTFPVSGSGYPQQPTNATTGIFKLKNQSTQAYYANTAYKVMWTALYPPYSDCCTASRTNRNEYTFPYGHGNQYMFTVSFVGNPHPSTGTKVIMELGWR